MHITYLISFCSDQFSDECRCMEFCSSLPGSNNLQTTLNMTVKIISEIPAVWWVAKSECYVPGIMATAIPTSSIPCRIAQKRQHRPLLCGSMVSVTEVGIVRFANEFLSEKGSCCFPGWSCPCDLPISQPSSANALWGHGSEISASNRF